MTQQSPEPTPSMQGTTREHENGTPIWLEHVQAWSTLAAAVVAFGGLTGVIITLRHGRRQQRIASGPYIRVDLGPAEGKTDFKAPAVHFMNTADVYDLARDEGEDEKVSLWTWVRNYQAHPLGFALAVSAFFVLELRKASASQNTGGDTEVVEFFDLRIPYIEAGKPVAVELFKIPRDSEASLWLASLTYYDFYDTRHEHWYGGPSTNALHGRLRCEYLKGSFDCVPEARPRGRKVEFESLVPGTDSHATMI